MKNIIKTILFAGLIAAMILPFSGMSNSYAQESSAIGHAETITTYAPIGNEFVPPLQPKNFSDIQTNADFVIEYDEKERKKLFTAIDKITNMINSTDNEILKKYLKNTLELMRPEMAKNGIVFADEYDSDPQKASDVIFKANEEKIKSFREALSSSETAIQSHTSYQYQSSAFVVYGCENLLTICYGQEHFKQMNAGDTFTVLGTIRQASDWRDLEFHHRITNLQTGSAYQGTYHSASMLDQNGNFLDGDTGIFNLWYSPGATKDIRFGTTPHVQNGYKVYEYLYVN